MWTHMSMFAAGWGFCTYYRVKPMERLIEELNQDKTTMTQQIS